MVVFAFRWFNFFFRGKQLPKTKPQQLPRIVFPYLFFNRARGAWLWEYLTAFHVFGLAAALRSS